MIKLTEAQINKLNDLIYDKSMNDGTISVLSKKNNIAATLYDDSNDCIAIIADKDKKEFTKYALKFFENKRKSIIKEINKLGVELVK